MYFVMASETALRLTSATSESEGTSFENGAVISTVPERLRLRFDVKIGGGLPDFVDDSPVPIMSARMSDMLVAAGVDNVQTFDVEVKDAAGQDYSERFRAFNVVGRIAAVDLEASVQRDTPALDAQPYFERLVIDEEIATPFNLFRLHEVPSFIVVSLAVKTALEANEISGVRFFASGERSD